MLCCRGTIASGNKLSARKKTPNADLSIWLAILLQAGSLMARIEIRSMRNCRLLLANQIRNLKLAVLDPLILVVLPKSIREATVTILNLALMHYLMLLVRSCPREVARAHLMQLSLLPMSWREPRTHSLVIKIVSATVFQKILSKPRIYKLFLTSHNTHHRKTNALTKQEFTLFQREMVPFQSTRKMMVFNILTIRQKHASSTTILSLKFSTQKDTLMQLLTMLLLIQQSLFAMKQLCQEKTQDTPSLERETLSLKIKLPVSSTTILANQWSRSTKSEAFSIIKWTIENHYPHLWSLLAKLLSAVMFTTLQVSMAVCLWSHPVVSVLSHAQNPISQPVTWVSWRRRALCSANFTSWSLCWKMRRRLTS